MCWNINHLKRIVSENMRQRFCYGKTSRELNGKHYTSIVRNSTPKDYDLKYLESMLSEDVSYSVIKGVTVH